MEWVGHSVSIRDDDGSCTTAQGALPSEVMNGSRKEVECEEENGHGRVRQKIDVGIVSEDESRCKDDKALAPPTPPPPLSFSLSLGSLNP